MSLACLLVFGCRGAAANECALVIRLISTDGQVICLGTPAEETTGGKIDLLKAGAFAGIHFCLMAHPSGVNITKPAILGLLEVLCFN